MWQDTSAKVKAMLTEYIDAALRKAKYEILPDGEGYYGHVPELLGVWANAGTLEDCRESLREVIEEWVALGLRLGHDLPLLDGLEVRVKTAS